MTNLRDYARSIPTATMTPQWRGGNSVAWEGKANDFLAAARRRIAGAATSTGAGGGAGGGAGAGAGASLPHGDWVCDMCTQQNMSDAPACCMCDSPRGTGNQATPTSATMPEDTALKEGIASCLLTFESQIQGSHRVRVAALYAGSVACTQPCRAHVGWRPHHLHRVASNRQTALWSAKAAAWKQALRSMGGRLLAFPSRPTPTPDPPQTLKHQHRCTLRRVTNRTTGVCDDCMMRLGKSPNAVAYWCAECDYDLCMACATSGRKVITCNFLNRKLWNLLLKVAKSTLVGDCLVPCMQRAWCIAHRLRAVCVAPSACRGSYRARAPASLCTRRTTPRTSAKVSSLWRPRSHRTCRRGTLHSDPGGSRSRKPCRNLRLPLLCSSA